jgi:uroporphyrinogen-III decarboxylase
MTDFARHNEEVRRVWGSFNAGMPVRVPVQFMIGSRYFLLNAVLNPEGHNFYDYMNNPDIMMEVQLSMQRWIRFNVPMDQEMGMPEKEWAGVGIDFQNVREAAWLGCEVRYNDNDVPDTIPVLREQKEKLDDMQIPDPLHGGLMEKEYEFYSYLEEKRKSFRFEGKPVARTIPGAIGTDGPFTVAAKLRGLTEVCTDIYEDPAFVRRLLDFATESIVVRNKAWMELTGQAYPAKSWHFGDDYIEILSRETYREFVLPCHKRLVSYFSTGGPNSVHLCGKAQHLFKILRDELNVQCFECGFPTDLGRGRWELGPDVTFKGNLHPGLLRDGSQAELEAAVRDIMSCGVKEGGRFIFTDGFNVSPHTPVKNMRIVYEQAKIYGRYDSLPDKEDFCGYKSKSSGFSEGKRS